MIFKIKILFGVLQMNLYHTLSNTKNRKLPGNCR